MPFAFIAAVGGVGLEDVAVSGFTGCCLFVVRIWHSNPNYLRRFKAIIKGEIPYGQENDAIDAIKISSS